MTLDLEQIKAAARAATPGEWFSDDFAMVRCGDGLIDCDSQVDADFIGIAANPAIVLALIAEIERLNAIINAPQSGDFLRAVSTEAEHQRQRWGTEHDAGKSPPDWFWLVGYLSGKALNAHILGNHDKAEHHMITTAAALYNWQRNLLGDTSMRPGIDGEQALAGDQHA